MPKRPKNPLKEIPYGAGSVRPRNGGYQARWLDETGVRHSRQFTTSDEANDFLRERWRSRRDGRTVTRATLTVADLIRDWLDRGRDDWRATTYATNRRYAELHTISAVGHLKADALDTLQVQQWIDKMRRSGMGAHYIGNCVRVLSSAYRQAMQIGLVRVNPVTGTKRPAIRKPEIVTWSVSDVAAVDAALHGDPMWQAVYRVALTTGMRPGELRALRWSDLDGATIRIERTMTRDHEDRVTVGTQTKTGKDRTVTLAASARDALKRWRPVQAERHLAARHWDAAGYVFSNSHGGPLSQTTWQQRHKRLIAQTGVPAITLHGLRHSFATIAMAGNVHPRIVAEILGHANIQTTLDRYSHPTSAMQRQAAEALDTALFGEVGTQDGTDG